MQWENIVSPHTSIYSILILPLAAQRLLQGGYKGEHLVKYNLILQCFCSLMNVNYHMKAVSHVIPLQIL